MNPLRQETISKAQLSNPDSATRSSLSLSVTTLQTEIPALDPAIDSGAENQSVCERNGTCLEDFWSAWHSHREYLIRLSMIWMNVSAEDAEDAFSDATIRAYEKYAAHASQISNERAWFARLLHNICIDKHRANKRLRNLYDKVKEVNSVDMAAFDIRYQTPEGNLLNSELSRRLRAAIENLPERLKAPVILRLVQGE